MKLSASRISVIMRCPREYVYKYVLGMKEAKSKALLFGSAWHSMLEKKEPDLTELKAMDPEYPFEDALMVMSHGYDVGFPEHVNEVAREIKVENEVRLGFIDSVVADDDGFWICENKTRSDIMGDDEARMLPALVQNMIYHHAAPEVADALWLDPAGYKGIKYVCTKKPGERRKKTETVEEFGSRLTSETQVIIIPKEIITGNPEPLFVQATARAEEAERAYTGGIESVPANTASCFRYNSPCPFFSECHKGVINEVGGRRVLGTS